MTLHHCTFGCSEQLIGADTHSAHFESSKKAPKPCHRRATTALVSDNTDFRFQHSSPGVPCLRGALDHRFARPTIMFKRGSELCTPRSSMANALTECRQGAVCKHRINAGKPFVAVCPSVLASRGTLEAPNWIVGNTWTFRLCVPVAGTVLTPNLNRFFQNMAGFGNVH